MIRPRGQAADSVGALANRVFFSNWRKPSKLIARSAVKLCFRICKTVAVSAHSDTRRIGGATFVGRACAINVHLMLNSHEVVKSFKS